MAEMVTGMVRPRTMVAAALGDCVHVAGLHAVLQTARQFGWPSCSGRQFRQNEW